MMRNALKRGFTMIELLIYMGLLSIVLTVLTAIFVAVLDTQLEAESLSTVQQDARFISARLFYDVNNATSINSPAVGNTETSLQLVHNGINYQYSLSGDNLVVTDNTGTYSLNSYGTGVSNLTFTRLGNSGGKHTIQIDMTVTSNIKDVGGDEVKRIQTTVGLR